MLCGRQPRALGAGLPAYFRRPSWLIMKNTICISLYSLATFPLSCILALMLNELDNQRFKKVVQMVSYAPHFISVTIMCAIIEFLSVYASGHHL